MSLLVEIWCYIMVKCDFDSYCALGMVSKDAHHAYCISYNKKISLNTIHVCDNHCYIKSKSTYYKCISGTVLNNKSKSIIQAFLRTLGGETMNVKLVSAGKYDRTNNTVSDTNILLQSGM
jgi:hypothetical protein